MWKGTSPDGSHYYPVFPYTSYQQMRLADVRDLFAYMKTLPAIAGQGAGSRPADSISRSAARSAAGSSCSSMDRRSSPTRRNRRSGIAAPTSPTRRATARSATARATCWAASSPASGSPAAPTRKAATAGCPTSPRPASAITPSGTSSACSRAATCPMATSVGGSMGKVVGNMSQLAAEDRAAIAAYIKSLPPVEGPKHP